MAVRALPRAAAIAQWEPDDPTPASGAAPVRSRSRSYIEEAREHPGSVVRGRAPPRTCPAGRVKYSGYTSRVNRANSEAAIVDAHL